MSRAGWLLALAFLGLIAFGGQAQESASHTHIGEWDGGNNTRKALDMARMLKERTGADLPQARIEPELIKQMLDILEKQGESGLQSALQKNPELRRTFSNLDQNNPELKRQLESRLGQRVQPGGMNPEQMQRWIEQFKSRTESRAGMPEPPIPNHPQLPSVSRPNTPPFEPNTPPRPPAAEPPTNDGTNPPDGSANAARSERFAEFMKRMHKWVPQSLKESASFKRFAERLGEMDWTKKASKVKLWPEGKGPKINWDRGIRRTGRLLDHMLSGLEGRHLPNLPSAPNLPNAPNMPNIGAPSAPGTFEFGRGFTMVMVLAALALGAFLFWRFIVKPISAQAAKPRTWEAGPWPVDPAQVRSREQLIRAFDHLALLNGGKPAEMWHHREVANRLGIESDERRAAADRLARIYESARYAPPVDPFEESQIDLARQDICSLAGVAAT